METSKAIIMTVVDAFGWDYVIYGSIISGVVGGIIGYYISKRV
jgi:hypothetical protein